MRTSTKSALAATLLLGTFAAGVLVRDYVRPGHFEVIALAQANNASEARRCSNRTLQGSYGIKFEGSSLSGGPFVSISLIIFDGAGQFTTTETGRFNGNLVHRTFTGPYTVNPDCTGFLDFSSNLGNTPHEAHGDFVIVDEGHEFFVIDNEAGWEASGVGKRV